MSDNGQSSTKEAEQIQLAREIGTTLTDAFIGFVRGQVAFEDLTFGVYDALHDLNVVRSGDYELVDEDEEHEHDHNHDSPHDDVLDEQEDLAQEPSRDDTI